MWMARSRAASLRSALRRDSATSSSVESRPPLKATHSAAGVAAGLAGNAASSASRLAASRVSVNTCVPGQARLASVDCAIDALAAQALVTPGQQRILGQLRDLIEVTQQRLLE